MKKEKVFSSNKENKLVNFYVDGKWQVIDLDDWLKKDPFRNFLKKLENK